MSKAIRIFVPGRLCIFGEHSDWASLYRKNDKRIEKGYAIAMGIDLGIECDVNFNNDFVLTQNDKHFTCSMNRNDLQEIVKNNTYYSYVASAIYVMLTKYDVKGLKINIISNTLPEKKGLSSSSAMCVLIIRAFNVFYNLGLNHNEEMELAYLAERKISKCGKIDQICAFGKQVSLLEFDGEQININKLNVGKDLYFVVADLNSNKNTQKILNDLNSSYIDELGKNEKSIVDCLGGMNKKIVHEAIDAFRIGDAKKIGALMNEAQYNFDKFITPKCVELTAPKLHTILSDIFVLKQIYGGKCVGSGGDGCVQFVVKNSKSQNDLIEYLNKNYNCSSYAINLKQNCYIKKGIVPLAGNGTRMYPYTKSIPKAFIPIVHKGMLKPIFMVILEEMYDSGIAKIALIIDKKDKKLYDDFFEKNNDFNSEYEQKIEKIYKSITYIYQNEKLGLAHAVFLCKKFVDEDDFLLVLGDQMPLSYDFYSCLDQLLTSYKSNKLPVIAATLTDINDVNNYGIIHGNLLDDNDHEFLIDKIFEKPTQEEAIEDCYLMRNNNKEYYSIFGYYVLNKNIFEIISDMIKNVNTENGEYQLTTALNKFIEMQNVKAVIINGKFLDVGNISAYCNSFKSLIYGGDKY